MAAPRNLPYHLLALILALGWGFTNISTKYLYIYGMGPWAVLALRGILAYGVLIFIAPKQLYAGTVKDEFKCFILGAAMMPGYFGMQNLALSYGQACAVSVAVATGPLMTALVAALLFRGLKLHWMTGLGAVAAATGLFLLWFDQSVMEALPPLAIWLALAGAAGFALYSLLLRSLANLPGLVALRKTVGYGTIAALPFFFSETPTEGMILANPVVMANLLYLSVGAIAVSTSLWLLAEKKIGAEACGFYFYVWPLAAVVGGLWLLGESMSYVGFMGAAMILCGVICAQAGLARIAAAAARRR